MSHHHRSCRKLPRVRKALAKGGLALVLLMFAACAPRLMPPGPDSGTPALLENHFRTEDGYELPLRVWEPPASTSGKIFGGPKHKSASAVVLALHGFNDYSNAFAMPAPYLANNGIKVYALDQRGFGAGPHAGMWGGTDMLVRDVRQLTSLLREKHPDLPLYLLGESMGGAIALSSLVEEPRPDVAGAALVAPAVWGRDTMPFYQTAALWLSAHTVPWMTLTGKGLGIVPSDNIEMLRDLGKDPLVIKGSRVDTVWGLVNMMDRALEAAGQTDVPLLVLYGEKDELVPKGPTLSMIESMDAAGDSRHRVALYEDGYHMLLRDLQAETVWKDLVAWIKDPAASLPSGSDKRDARELLDQ